MNLIKKMKLFLADKLMLSYLNEAQKIQLFMYFIFLLGAGLSGIFVNVFLFSAEGSFINVLTYNGTYFVSVIVFSAILGTWGKKVPLSTNITLGIFGHVALYILLLVFGGNASKYCVIFGLFSGFGATFFYVANNCFTITLTSQKGRDIFLSIQGMIAALPTLITPMISGFILESIDGIKGYIIIFSITLVMFVFAGLVSFKIPIVKSSEKSYFFSMLVQVVRRKNLRFACIGEIFRGTREGSMFFLPTVFLFANNPSELVLSVYSLFCGLLYLVSYFILGKTATTEKKRSILMIIGVITMFLSGFLLISKINTTLMFVYGFITSITHGFLLNGATTIFYGALTALPNLAKRSLEGVSIREIMLNTGRTIAILIIVLIPKTEQNLAICLVVFGALQFLCWYFYKKVKTNF